MAAITSSSADQPAGQSAHRAPQASTRPSSDHAATHEDHVAPREDDLATREIAAEQHYVDRVYRQLETATRSAKQVQQDGRSRYLTDRSDFLRPEEHGTALFERDAFAFQAAKRLAVLDAEHEGLVFGRLDMLDHEVNYIGRLGVRDDDFEPLVIDWRAPAAEPFYRATPTSPMSVVRRRVLRSRGETVIGIEDDLLDTSEPTELAIVGEGALMAALTRARGHQMRDIVATIQAEQDEAIRAPYQGVTTIAGGPGTGKTVVALHRAAYLLYSHRKRLEKGGVLVVGPSAVFMNYIERVLPSLGEDAVTLRSIGAVVSDVLDVVSDRTDPADAATLKGSLKMLPVLRRIAHEPLITAPEAQLLRVTIKGEVLTLDAPRLRRLRHDVLAGHKLNQGRPTAETLLLNSLWQQYQDRIASNEPDAEPDPDEIALGPREPLTRDEFDDLVTSQASWVMFLNAWWPPISPQQALARLADPDGMRLLAGDLLDARQREILAASYAHLADVAPERYSIADVALLDELVHLLGPVPKDPDAEPNVFIEGGDDVAELVTMADRLRVDRDEDSGDEPHDTYAHVLVDEAQDITPMQWRMLRRRGPQASWTLVGDPAQSSWPDPAETAEAVRQLIGSAPSRRFRLSTNYRSPAEVFDLAAQVIERVYPDADLPDAVRRTGVEPELLSAPRAEAFARIDEIVAGLLTRVEGTVGVICPPSVLREWLTARPTQETDSADSPDADSPDSDAVMPPRWPHLVDPRVVVVGALQAKGLEYDAALVVAPDAIVEENPGRERVLYVALTRPTQLLVTLDLVDEHSAGDHWRDALTD